MLGGFDPRLRDGFFPRRRTQGFVGALLVYLASVAFVVWMQEPAPEETVEVQLEPEIQDFDVEEEEPEVEEEPPPPPPPDTKVKVVDKPKPRPKIKTPDKKVTEAADESKQEKTVEVGPGAPSPGANGERVEPPKPKAEPKPKPKAEPKAEPKPKPKAGPKIDPTQPIDRPENATAPKPLAGNPKPEYPKELRDKGVTGSVLLKLHVHRDGTVRGAKILRKKNNATTEEEQKRADKLFLQAVVAVVKSWKYEPAKLNGQPITVWHKVNIPFSLTAAD
jgi:protein TonB